MTNRITKAHTKQTWLKASDISVVHAAAQRQLVQKWATKIANDWDPDKMSPLTVARVNGDGSYHCIDGQHRLAAIEMLGMSDMQVPVVVKKADTVAEAAEQFYGANESLRVHAVDKFKTRVLWDETAAAVNAVIEEQGWTVRTGPDNDSFNAVQAAEQIADKHGLHHLGHVLSTVALAFGNTQPAVHNAILRGFSEVLLADNVDAMRLADRASVELTPASLRAKAAAIKDSLGGSVAKNVARVLAGVYNTRLRGHKIDVG